MKNKISGPTHSGKKARFKDLNSNLKKIYLEVRRVGRIVSQQKIHKISNFNLQNFLRATVYYSKAEIKRE